MVKTNFLCLWTSSWATSQQEGPPTSLRTGQSILEVCYQPRYQLWRLDVRLIQPHVCHSVSQTPNTQIQLGTSQHVHPRHNAWGNRSGRGLGHSLWQNRRSAHQWNTNNSFQTYRNAFSLTGMYEWQSCHSILVWYLSWHTYFMLKLYTICGMANTTIHFWPSFFLLKMDPHERNWIFSEKHLYITYILLCVFKWNSYATLRN